ncbi:MAG TPA: hypothetical protein VNB64_00785 [Solirubrobacteraceae bacterium]|nr:hypothetical protein [Solirubrobacteraceae bacterium]
MSRAVATAALCLLAAAGCGNRETPDLFAVERYGSVPAARLSLRVNDNGQVRCNGGERRRMADQLVLDARGIARELNEVAPRTLAPRPGSVLRYRLELEEGAVRFADNSRGQSEEMFETQAFVRRVAREVCGLPR